MMRPFFVTPCRLQKIESVAQEKVAEVIPESVRDENLIFEITTRCNTVEKLLAFERDNSSQFTTVHRSVVLARLRNLLIEENTSLSPNLRFRAQ